MPPCWQATPLGCGTQLLDTAARLPWTHCEPRHLKAPGAVANAGKQVSRGERVRCRGRGGRVKQRTINAAAAAHLS